MYVYQHLTIILFTILLCSKPNQKVRIKTFLINLIKNARLEKNMCNTFKKVSMHVTMSSKNILRENWK